MKRYIIRSVKYLLAISLLYVGLMWIMHQLHHADITFKERFIIMFEQGWRGWGTVVAIILLAATYPFFGFVKRHFNGDIILDREQLNRAAEFTGLVLVAEDKDELVYRAKGLRRLMALFEDEVRLRQDGDKIEIEGLRRIAVRMAFDADRYITNKRRSE